MKIAFVCLLLAFARFAAADPLTAAAPRIVNIYNFCRNSDYRLQNSQDTLFHATEEQIRQVHANHLVGTWAMQYDALINPRYQALFKSQLGPGDELAGWWEIPRPLAEKAGLTWRGQHDWDSASNVGFSPGYTPEQRRHLVDVYMEDFKATFGYTPKTVGSWYIDEVTLAYMAEKYGIVASCNCKDQVGTDGYTLWGGYWNQAYYPSRLNSYMPAQTAAGQINVPVFRMLGSDPIYQYPGADAIYSLEPVYSYAGGSPAWVDWFFGEMIHQPALAFAFTQAGQENSFGWDAMKSGFDYQMKALAARQAAGEVRVETLGQSGQWFRSRFAVTPPTSVVCLHDWRHQGRKTVWYDSRFYRADFLWDDRGLVLRDLHRFDERKISPTHDTVLTARALAYQTLPIVEGALWAGDQGDASAVPLRIDPQGRGGPMAFAGEPAVTQINATDLRITQPLRSGGTFTIVCTESSLAFTASDANQRPFAWAWELRGGKKQADAITRIAKGRIDFGADGFGYALRIEDGRVSQDPAGTIRLLADDNGRLSVLLSE